MTAAARLEQKAERYDRAWDALEAGDIDAFMEIVDDESSEEIEFSSGIGTVVGGGTYKGTAGIREWFSELLTISGTRTWTERRYEAVGDDIIVFFAQLEFTGAASDVPVKSETGAVMRYRGDRIVRIDSFTSHREAREFAEAFVSRSEATASSDADA